jgi:hypothetical protein
VFPPRCLLSKPKSPNRMTLFDCGFPETLRRNTHGSLDRESVICVQRPIYILLRKPKKDEELPDAFSLARPASIPFQRMDDYIYHLLRFFTISTTIFFQSPKCLCRPYMSAWAAFFKTQALTSMSLPSGLRTFPTFSNCARASGVWIQSRCADVKIHAFPRYVIAHIAP